MRKNPIPIQIVYIYLIILFSCINYKNKISLENEA